MIINIEIIPIFPELSKKTKKPIYFDFSPKELEDIIINYSEQIGIYEKFNKSLNIIKNMNRTHIIYKNDKNITPNVENIRDFLILANMNESSGLMFSPCFTVTNSKTRKCIEIQNNVCNPVGDIYFKSYHTLYEKINGKNIITNLRKFPKINFSPVEETYGRFFL